MMTRDREKEEKENQLAVGGSEFGLPELSSGVGYDQTSIAPGGEREYHLPGQPVDQIGQYEIVREIGRGGMGCVYEAEQTHPVRRKVALKVILAGRDSQQVIARFNAERQALALMDHPTIARILDAGETSLGQPFFAMELIDGEALTAYCDRKKLTLEDRLSLFCQICSGIQHAHQKSVIHRDLKPGNILVTEIDGKPVPKIIDFGLAKALETSEKLTDQTIQTEVGLVLGTIKYMSPEQAGWNNLDIDTRTDIYSLGVILYELLTGSTPLDSKSIKQVALLAAVEMVRNCETPRPSSKVSDSQERLSTISHQRRIHPKRLNQILAGELDWIVMRSLEKDRDRRYSSAGEFADDIQRYLNDEPVQARPPSIGYQLQKFVRKNRVLVSVFVSVIAILLAGVVGTSYGLVKARRSAIAEKAAKESAQNSARAEKSARKLAQKKERAQRAIFSFLLSAFGAGDPLFGNFVSEYGIEFSQDSSFREVIQQIAQTELSELSALKEFPLIRAGVQSQLGDVLFSNGDVKLSLELQQKSHKIYVEKKQVASLEFAKCLTSLASCQFFLGDLVNAKKNFSEAANVYSQFDEQLLDSRQKSYLIHLRQLHGIVEFSSWKLESAKEQFEKILSIEQPDNIAFPIQKAFAKFMILRIQTELGGASDFDKLKLIGDAIASIELDKLEGSVADLISMVVNAQAFVLAEQDEMAINELRRVENVVTDRLGNDHFLNLIAKFFVAMGLKRKEKYDQAILEFESLDKLVSIKLNRRHPIYGFAMYEHSKALLSIWNAANDKSTVDLEKSKTLMTETMELWKKSMGENHRLTSNATSYLGRICYAQKNYEESLAWYEKCLVIREKVYEKPSNAVAQTHFRISKCFKQLERFQREYESLSRALEIEKELTEADGTRTPGLGYLEYRLAKNLIRRNMANPRNLVLLDSAIKKMKQAKNKYVSALQDAVKLLETHSE